MMSSNNLYSCWTIVLYGQRNTAESSAFNRISQKIKTPPTIYAICAQIYGIKFVELHENEVS